MTCGHSYRNLTNFPYEIGRKYIVALSSVQQMLAVRNLQLADDALIKEVEQACAAASAWLKYVALLGRNALASK